MGLSVGWWPGQRCRSPFGGIHFLRSSITTAILIIMLASILIIKITIIIVTINNRNKTINNVAGAYVFIRHRSLGPRPKPLRRSIPLLKLLKRQKYIPMHMKSLAFSARSYIFRAKLSKRIHESTNGASL